MKREQKKALAAVRRWTNRANSTSNFWVGWVAIGNAARIGKRAGVSLHRKPREKRRVKSIQFSVEHGVNVEFE